VYNNAGNPILTNVTFRNNYALTLGGGMFTQNGSPLLTGVKFRDNSSSWAGGFYHQSQGNPSLVNVTFSGNTATIGGGVVNLARVTLANVLFSGNWGSGFYNSGSNADALLVNVTFSGNRSSASGGALQNVNGANVTLVISILWNNAAGSVIDAIAQLYNDDESTATVRDSIVQHGLATGVIDGGNNSQADPQFVMPVDPAGAPTTAGDLRLLLDSPAIDAGDDSVVSASTDADANPRILGYAVDQGAYESTYPDLNLVKTVSPSTVLPGQPLTYTLRYGNIGGQAAQDVIITDVVSSLLTDVQIKSGGPAIAPAGSTDYAWTVEELAGQTEGTITITARLSSTLNTNTSFDNTATITSSTAEVGTSDNQSTVTVTAAVPVVQFATGIYEADEAAGTLPVTVTLDSANPYADVRIVVSSQDHTATVGKDYEIVSPAVTIPAGQREATFDLALLDNDFDDADAIRTATLSLVSPEGATPGALSTATLRIVDDDVAGVNVQPDDELEITEAGGADTFELTLNSEPTAPVTVFLASDDFSEAIVSPAIISFNTDNWNEPQTVNVIGVDDDVTDGDVTFTVDGSSRSDDAFYAGLPLGPLQGTNEDDDEAGVTIAPSSPLVTTEAGGSDTFTVALSSEPTSTVMVTISSTDPEEGSPSPVALSFDAGNWHTPQTVTVTGVDDDVDDGDTTYAIETIISSNDSDYDGFDPVEVTATNVDDDGAGFTVIPAAGLLTTEAGGTDTFDVVLDSAPTGMVTVTLSSSNSGEGTVNPHQLVFNSANWSTAQTVTLTGVDDDVDDGDVVYSIETAVSSDDLAYDDISVLDFSVTNLDDDVAGVSVDPTGDLVTNEAGLSEVIAVALDSEPTAIVTVTFSSSDSNEVAVSPAMLFFDAGNWNAPQQVAVSGVDDEMDDGDVAYTVEMDVHSEDTRYDGMSIAGVAGTNLDDDTAGIVITPSMVEVAEGSEASEYTVRLQSQPGAMVLLTIPENEQVIAAPVFLVFNAVNWNVPQTITVQATDDDLQEGPHSTLLQHTVTSDNPAYNSLAAEAITVSIVDNDYRHYLPLVLD
jgi:uncharacterized repeat protein (TIGR01451 family)